jgi:hypothetical protein
MQSRKGAKEDAKKSQIGIQFSKNSAILPYEGSGVARS